MILVSLVVPVYSGELYLRTLVLEVKQLRQSLENSGAPIAIAELIFIEDAAIDSSGVIIDELAFENSWITALHLSRNFGQHAATAAGILHTCGDWVVTLDEDLQHPPMAILEMFKVVALKQCDIVYAKPQGDIHGGLFRDAASRHYKRIIKWITGNSNVQAINSFRLIRGSIARSVSSVCTHDTYLDIALSWFSLRVETVDIKLTDQRYINHGKSGYNIKSLLSHARRMFISAQIKILRIGAAFGLAVAVFALFAGAALFLYKILFPDTAGAVGWTSLILATTFFGGLILLLLGIVLEYLSVLVLQAHGKPLFFTIDRSQDNRLVDFFKV